MTLQIDKLEAELARLRAENEKLTARVGDPTANTPANAYWRQRFGTSDSEVKHLRAENEKLRAAATSVIANAGAIENDAMYVRVLRHLVGQLRTVLEQDMTP